MRTLPKIAYILGILVSLYCAPVLSAGQAPDPKICNDANNPPQDVVVQGGCIAITRTKGNCQACHLVPGIASGNIAPPLTGVVDRINDPAKLRAQIENPLQFSAKTVMPPYGKHEILSPAEIDKVIIWLKTL